MNGIIHNCTHKDSDSPTFRMTEEKMFIDIFNYIEHLFGKIKPKKLFFMAIDVWRFFSIRWAAQLLLLSESWVVNMNGDVDRVWLPEQR